MIEYPSSNVLLGIQTLTSSTSRLEHERAWETLEAQTREEQERGNFEQLELAHLSKIVRHALIFEHHPKTQRDVFQVLLRLSRDQLVGLCADDSRQLLQRVFVHCVQSDSSGENRILALEFIRDILPHVLVLDTGYLDSSEGEMEGKTDVETLVDQILQYVIQEMELDLKMQQVGLEILTCFAVASSSYREQIFFAGGIDVALDVLANPLLAKAALKLMHTLLPLLEILQDDDGFPAMLQTLIQALATLVALEDVDLYQDLVLVFHALSFDARGILAISQCRPLEVILVVLKKGGNVPNVAPLVIEACVEVLYELLTDKLTFCYFKQAVATNQIQEPDLLETTEAVSGLLETYHDECPEVMDTRVRPILVKLAKLRTIYWTQSITSPRQLGRKLRHVEILPSHSHLRRVELSEALLMAQEEVRSWRTLELAVSDKRATSQRLDTLMETSPNLEMQGLRLELERERLERELLERHMAREQRALNETNAREKKLAEAQEQSQVLEKQKRQQAREIQQQYLNRLERDLQAKTCELEDRTETFQQQQQEMQRQLWKTEERVKEQMDWSEARHEKMEGDFRDQIQTLERQNDVLVQEWTQGQVASEESIQAVTECLTMTAEDCRQKHDEIQVQLNQKRNELNQSEMKIMSFQHQLVEEQQHVQDMNARFSELSSTMNAALAESEKKNQMLSEMNLALEKKNAHLRSDYGEMEQKLQDLRMKQSQSQEAISGLVNEKQEMELDLKKFRFRFVAAQHEENEAQQQTLCLQDQFEALQAQCSDFQRKNSMQEEAKTEIELQLSDLQKQYQLIHDQCEDLQKEISEAHEKNSIQEGEKIEIEHQLHSLQSQFTTAQQDIAHEEKEKNSFQERLINLQKEHLSVQEEYQYFQNEYEEIQQDHSSLEIEKERVDQELVRLQSDYNILQDKYQSQTNEAQQYTSNQESEKNKLVQELLRLQAQINEAQEECSNQKNEKKESQANLLAIENEYKLLQNQFQSGQIQLNEAKEDMSNQQDEKNEVEQQLLHLRREYKSVQDQYQSLLDQFNEVKENESNEANGRKEIEQQLLGAQNDYRLLKDQCKNLQVECDAAQENISLQEHMQQQIKQQLLNAENDHRLVQEKISLQEHMQKEIEKQLLSTQNDHRLAQDQCKNLQVEYNAAQEKISLQEHMQQEIEKQLLSAQNDYRSAQEQFRNSQEKISLQKRDQKEIEKQMLSAQNDYRLVQEQYQNLQVEYNAAQEKISRQERGLKELEDQSISAQNDHRLIEDQYQNLQAEYNAAQEKISRQERGLKELEDQSISAQNDYRSIQAEYQNFQASATVNENTAQEMLDTMEQQYLERIQALLKRPELEQQFDNLYQDHHTLLQEYEGLQQSVREQETLLQIHNSETIGQSKIHQKSLHRIKELEKAYQLLRKENQRIKIESIAETKDLEEKLQIAYGVLADWSDKMIGQAEQLQALSELQSMREEDQAGLANASASNDQKNLRATTMDSPEAPEIDFENNLHEEEDNNQQHRGDGGALFFNRKKFELAEKYRHLGELSKLYRQHLKPMILILSKEQKTIQALYHFYCNENLIPHKTLASKLGVFGSLKSERMTQFANDFELIPSFLDRVTFQSTISRAFQQFHQLIPSSTDLNTGNLSLSFQAFQIVLVLLALAWGQKSHTIDDHSIRPPDLGKTCIKAFLRWMDSSEGRQRMCQNPNAPICPKFSSSIYQE